MTMYENTVHSKYSNLPIYDELHQSFADDEIEFIHFSQLDKTLTWEVLAWRNHPEIRRWMYNKNIISEKDHLQFLRQLPQQRQRYYWLVRKEGKNWGVVDLSNYQNGESEWGFYINPAYMGSGKAIQLFHHALQFFFTKIGLRRVYGYVGCYNTNSLLLNELFDMQQEAFVARKQNGITHWYTKYAMTQQAYLEQGNSLGEIKKRLLGKGNEVRYKRDEIAVRQLLIQAFGMPDLPWFGTANLLDSSRSTHSLKLTYFLGLLKEKYNRNYDLSQLMQVNSRTELMTFLKLS